MEEYPYETDTFVGQRQYYANIGGSLVRHGAEHRRSSDLEYCVDTPLMLLAGVTTFSSSSRRHGISDAHRKDNFQLCFSQST
jgi:hypothetical protein